MTDTDDEWDYLFHPQLPAGWLLQLVLDQNNPEEQKIAARLALEWQAAREIAEDL